ncbi:MAG TPA: type II secretion system secretin GspD, partial [Candidatus Binatia bacterium]
MAKRIAGWTALVTLAGVVVPLAAQQTPLQPPAVPRRAPVAAQPTDPNTPQGSSQGAPQVQQAPPVTPQPGATLQTPEGTTPQVPPTTAGPQRRFAPSRTAPSGGMISLNFNRADLVEIIHIIAQQLRLTYTIDPEVKGTVTINSAEPLRSEDLLPIFHQVLRMNGAVAVRTGNLYHIMPIKDGKGLVRPVGQNKEDSFALQVIPVRFFAVAEMKRVLTPFLQPGGEIVDNPRGNFLIVMDLPSNIQRLTEIADMIDVQVFAGTRMEIYAPKVASADELAQEMTKVMQSFASSVPQAENFAAEFIALPRINQLLVISHSEAAWTYAKRWLDRIDVVAEGPGRRIFIYPVENGKATELADVLSQALGQPSTGRRESTRTLEDLHRSTPGGTSSLTGQSSMGSSFGSPGSLGQQNRPLGAYAAVPAAGQIPQPSVVSPQPVAPPQAPGVGRPPVPPAQAQQQEQLRIVPDPATNSLIIYGTVQEFQNIKSILKDLDAIPRQVLLDVLVAEVTLGDNQSLGVDYEILRRNPATIFGQKFPSAGAIKTLGDVFPATGAFGGGVSGVFGGKDIAAFINALQSDSRFKVLSSPSILATDNRPARIQVGTEEPVATGTTTAQVGTVASSTSIQYRNTGRIVTIIPQVNSQGLVNLQILAEVSQRRDKNVDVGADSFPAFDTRQAETTAVVQDGDSLVIGGIITDNKNRTRSGVPYLMDIPVIGRFFSSTSDTSERTELLMLITPHVIRNRSDAQAVSEDFKSKIGFVRSELERMARDRAKSLPKPRPEEMTPTPALPPGSEQPPTQNPGSLPPSPGASLAPLVEPPAILSRESPSQPGFGSGKAASTLPAPSFNKPSNAPAAEPREPGGAERPTNQPAYALTAAHLGAITPTPVPIPAKIKVDRLWAVQVAALAEEKSAQAMVHSLREQGYDAYVML